MGFRRALLWAGCFGGVATAALAASAAPASVTEAAAADSAASVPGLGWNELLRESEKLVFEPGDARRSLRHHFVQFGSEAVRAGDSLLVRNRDYGIDYGRGVVFLLSRPATAVELDVEYLFLPGPRQRTFRAAEIATREAALAATPATAPGPDGHAAAADAGAVGRPPTGPNRDALPSTLQLTGSNSIGVSFGRNREASLDQSLRVEVAGDLGDDLKVNAVLADDNLPVTAEGSTEELGDLSKVFIEMQGPVVGGVIGDYALGRTQGDLIDFRRDLRGGELRLDFESQKLAVGAGLAKGNFETATFRGVEGKQGPYELLSARRIELSTIVPGSERVYLDGRVLRRGENQDYVIDYDRGELRFMNRRRITADSEIGVDFQVNGSGYRRQTYDARHDGKLGRFELRGLLFSEGDDREAPFAGPYRPDEIAALEAAGDQPVVAPGIHPVEPGRGLYRFDALDSTIVRYDPITGDLEVEFFEAGAGLGAYDDSLDALSGRRIFVHRGAGGGSFDIGRRLVPASQHRLASAQLIGAPWPGARLQGEFTVSGFDANVFSAQGDEDNNGEAADLRFDVGRQATDGTGGAGIALHYAQLSARFRAPGRARQPFYYKEWNAESDSLRDTERIAEATAGYGFGGERRWLRLDANAGRLDRRDDLVTDRLQFDVALGRDPQRGVDFRAQVLDSERPALGPDAGRQRDFLRAGGRYRLGRLLPELRLERDAFVRADADSLVRASYRYLDVMARLGVFETARTTVTLEAGRRDTDARRSAAERASGLEEWRPSRRNDTFGVDLRVRPTTSIDAELDLSRRTHEPRGEEIGSLSRSDLARTLVTWAPKDLAARAEWRYELSDEAVRSLQQVFVLAPDGKGDFDAEGRPLGRDLGTHDRVVRFAGDVEPVSQIETSLRLDFGGPAGWGLGLPDTSTSWVRRNVSLTQIVALKEQSRSDHIARLALLVPSEFQNGNTAFGSFKARQEWSFLNASTADALRLFLELQNDLDGRLVDNAVRDRQRTATLRFEHTGVQRWTWGSELAVALRERSGRLEGAVIGRPASGTFHVLSARGVLRVGLRPSPSERLGVDFEILRQTDDVSSTQQLLLTATPTVTLAPTRNLRLLGTVAATQVFEDKPEFVLAPYFFDPPGTKASVSLLGSYRLGRSLQFNVNYTGIRGTDGRFTYDAKAETRAIF